MDKTRPASPRTFYDRLAPSPLGKRVATGTFWSLLGTGLSRGATFVALLLVARILGRETFGQFGLIRATAMTFVAFSSFGMGLAATKYIAQLLTTDRNRTGRIIALSYLVTVIASLVVASIFYASAAWICETRLAAPHLVGSMRLGAVLLFLTTLTGTQIGVMTGFQDFRSLAAANALSGVATVPIYVFGALFHGLNGVLLAAVLAVALNLAVNAFFVRKNMRKHGIPFDCRRALREMPILWSSNVPTVLSSIIVGLSVWVPQLLLGLQPGGAAELGVYHVVLNFQAIMLFLPHQLSPVLLPILSEPDKEPGRFRRIAWKGWLLSFAAAGLVSLPFFLFPKWFLAWTGPEYLDGTATLRAACLAVLASTGGIALYSALVGRGRFWSQLAVSVLSTAATVLSALAFLSADFGAAGLFLAQTAGAVTFVVLGIPLLCENEAKP